LQVYDEQFTIEYINRNFVFNARDDVKIFCKNFYGIPKANIENDDDFKTLKAGAVLFNAGCNEHVFSPKPKKIGADPFCRF